MKRTVLTCSATVLLAGACGVENEDIWNNGTCDRGVEQISSRFTPQWLKLGPFSIGDNPVKPEPPGPAGPAYPSHVWKSTGAVPDTAVFAVPFQAGDRLIGLSFDALGDPDGKGLDRVGVYYLGGRARYSIELASGIDKGRSSKEWGSFDMLLDKPIGLGSDSEVWVELSVTASNYYIGAAKTIVQRTCDYNETPRPMSDD